MDHLERRLKQANAFLDARNWASAIEELKTVLHDYPRSARVLHVLALALLESGETSAAMLACQQALAIQPDSPAILNLWGTLCAGRGDHEQAVNAFRQAVGLRKHYAIAWHNLANSLHILGQGEDAARAYAEAVCADPDRVESQFELAALGDARIPSAAPPRYVEQFFDGFAANFDRHLASLSYSVTEAIFENVAPFVERIGSRLDILDVGCGTGLAGEKLQSVAQSQTGVDLSSAMLEIARQKRIYDRLVHDELVHYLETTSDRFGLVVAADVLIHFGDLQVVLAAVRRVLQPGGLFSFSVELTETGDYRLAETRRFLHSTGYIEGLIRATGFTQLVAHDVNIRVENGGPIAGMVYVLQVKCK